MAKMEFSKDPKVKLVSLDKFLNSCNYFCDFSKNAFWDYTTIPDQWGGIYYKITSCYLISIQYNYSHTNFGMDVKPKFEEIIVASRDGKTEYDLFEKKLLKLQTERSKFKKNIEIDKKIKELRKSKKLLTEYKEKPVGVDKPFDSYLIDTGYKTPLENIKNKYIVFDIETNGLRKSNDDLLSLSIYDPTTGMCYDRFLPLELQPLVLTTFIHGITDEDLVSTTHITQEEMDWLYEYFDLKNRVLLSFSGGQGTFDSSFVSNYCKRHNIIGFEDLKFENIKNKMPTAPFGCEGQLTKDNLCRMFGIDGIYEIHSSYYDCILQWKLFEKLESECLFFINNSLYQYTPEYIIPCSYLFKHPDLIKYADINIPNIRGDVTEVTRLTFPKRLLKEIAIFPTNIIGKTIEHAINIYLSAKKQDNYEFLHKNRTHLKFVASLDNRIIEIPIIPDGDGTIDAINAEDKTYVEIVNKVTKIIIDHIKTIADYLRMHIFKDKKIMTQELSFSNDKKVLALCDLSDSKSVVEIKTCEVLSSDGTLKESIVRQLFYQANDRDTYLLSVKFDNRYLGRINESIIDDLNVILYKVQISEYNPIIHTVTLNKTHIMLLKQIEINSKITNKALFTILKVPTKASVTRYLEQLEKLKYIKKDTESRKNGWIILRDIQDAVTHYQRINGEIVIVKK